MEEDYLENFNFLYQKKESQNIRLGLRRIEKALSKIKKPCNKTPAIQIIGTNGKGSITAFLESILSLNSFNIGVTTSPHLFDICERIKINKKQISKKELKRIANDIYNPLKIFKLSPFEFIICCALKFFDERKVDLLLLEAGLGGRLDATSAHKLRPIIAIGKIGIDHSEYLGDTIEKITQEKIAVIQKNCFVISCKQDSEVEALINKKIQEEKANIIWVNPLSKEWELGLKGAFQRENAAVALGVITILNKLGWDIKPSFIKKGFRTTKWPGRLELVEWKNKKILIDSAHNPLAAEILSKERECWDNQEKGVYWILGVQKNKDFPAIAKKLFKSQDKLLLVPVPNHKSWKIDEISENINLNEENIIEFNSFNLAFNFLEELDEWPACNPVLTGSIFLVSAFINELN